MDERDQIPRDKLRPALIEKNVESILKQPEYNPLIGIIMRDLEYLKSDLVPMGEFKRSFDKISMIV